jgi:hypothetical protein
MRDLLFGDAAVSKSTERTGAGKPSARICSKAYAPRGKSVIRQGIQSYLDAFIEKFSVVGTELLATVGTPVEN